MRKTTKTENIDKVLVDINGLMQMLSIGKNSARDIGEQAGAVVRFGKRKLYKVDKITEYIAKL